MSKNFIDEGTSVSYKNTGAGIIYSGSVVVMNAIVGVTLGDIAVGATGTVRIVGAFKLPKDGATALEVGKAAFWDTVNKKVVAASGANIVACGTVVADASASATTVNVKINA